MVFLFFFVFLVLLVLLVLLVFLVFLVFPTDPEESSEILVFFGFLVLQQRKKAREVHAQGPPFCIYIYIYIYTYIHIHISPNQGLCLTPETLKLLWSGARWAVVRWLAGAPEHPGAPDHPKPQTLNLKPLKPLKTLNPKP